jgi:hypothetical protein
LYGPPHQFGSANLVKIVILMVEYKTLLVKIILDYPSKQQAKLNYENLCDFQVLLGLAYILPLLEYVHVLIKFAQMRDFLCVI